MMRDKCFWTHVRGMQARSNKQPRLVVIVMPIMGVMLTIQTGRCAAHSAAWLAGVPATGLAQHYSPPEIAGELAHFLCQGHRLIEVGQELTETRSSCHVFTSPHSVCSIVSRSHVLVSTQGTSLSGKRSLCEPEIA